MSGHGANADGPTLDAVLNELEGLPSGEDDAVRVRAALDRLVGTLDARTAGGGGLAPSGEALGRMVAILSRFLIDHPRMRSEAAPYGEAQLNAVIAEEWTEGVLHHCSRRHGRRRGLPGPSWSASETRQYLRPFLDHMEQRVARCSTAHVTLSLAIHRGGYEPVRDVWRAWLAELDARGLGLPDVAGGIERAEAIRVGGWDSFRWVEHGAPIAAMMDDPHPVVACAAANYIGGLYYVGEVEDDAASPSLAAHLERLRRPTTVGPGHSAFPRSLAGAFAGGFEYEFATTFLDQVRGAGIVPEDWFLDVLALPYHPDDDTLLETEALWFVIHEAFCFDPPFVHRLVDAGHDWIALMTATEMRQRVTGMEDVLARLSEGADAMIAERARYWLRTFYAGSVGSTPSPTCG